MNRTLPEGHTVTYAHMRFLRADVDLIRAQINQGHYRGNEGHLRLQGATEALASYPDHLKGDFSQYGGRTHATVVDAEGHVVGRGLARCSVLDQYSRPLGRTIALGRALGAMERDQRMAGGYTVPPVGAGAGAATFYVGGTFTRYREVRAVVDSLAAAGMACSLDWTRDPAQFDAAGDLLPSQGDGYQVNDSWLPAAEREVAAVKNADVCVFLGQEASLGWTTEFGAAIACGCPRILLVAPFKTTVFMALPQVEVHPDVASALAALGAA